MSKSDSSDQAEPVQEVICGSLSVKISDADIFRLVQAFGIEPSDEVEGTNFSKGT
jgi:hypothetical protein